jgi:hypothetical protein
VVTAVEAAVEAASALAWADLDRVMIGSLIVSAFVFVFAGIVAGFGGWIGWLVKGWIVVCDTGRACCDTVRCVSIGGLED